MGTSPRPAPRMLPILPTLATVLLVLATTSAMEIQTQEASIAPKERGFFRLACYSTCSAASFASTTSCTFGGFFWSMTLNCQQIFPLLSANASGRKLAPKSEERGFFRSTASRSSLSSLPTPREGSSPPNPKREDSSVLPASPPALPLASPPPPPAHSADSSGRPP